MYYQHATRITRVLKQKCKTYHNFVKFCYGRLHLGDISLHYLCTYNILI